MDKFKILSIDEVTCDIVERELHGRMYALSWAKYNANLHQLTPIQVKYIFEMAAKTLLGEFEAKLKSNHAPRNISEKPEE